MRLDEHARCAGGPENCPFVGLISSLEERMRKVNDDLGSLREGQATILTTLRERDSAGASAKAAGRYLLSTVLSILALLCSAFVALHRRG